MFRTGRIHTGRRGPGRNMVNDRYFSSHRDLSSHDFSQKEGSMVNQKIASGILTALVLMFSVAGHRVFAMDGDWERVSNGICGAARITCVKGIDGTDTLYAGTSDGLYVKTDPGKRWRKEDSLSTGVSVTDIAFSGKDILVATKSGLYISMAEKAWKRVPGKKDLKGVIAIEGPGERSSLVWSSNELFLVENGSWKHIGPKMAPGGIADVVYKHGLIYAGVKGEVFYSSDKGKTWKKCPVPGIVEGEEDGMEEGLEEDVGYRPFIRKIDHAGPYGVAVATGKGIFVIHGEADVVNRIDTTGLPASSVSDTLNSEKGLFAAAGDKVFLYSPEGYAWQPFFENASGGAITCLMTVKDRTGRAWFWVAAEKGMYRRGMDSFSAFAQGQLPRRVPGREPLIKEVHGMAVEYAEVSPEKIKKMRYAAQNKAWLPKLSLGLDSGFSRTIDLDRGGTNDPDFYITGPEENDFGWDVSLSWNLGELIWNDDQTNIDVRSKLMVQLRDDILEEVTRLYFERKRLLSELDRMGKKDKELPEKQLRIEELTAYIDALTGGAFSKAIDAERSG